jgi:glycosyltransferase involved in cell wall biosynthesis
LLDKISYLLIENEKRSAMATNGLKTVVKYDWKQVGKLYLDIYESLLH